MHHTCIKNGTLQIWQLSHHKMFWSRSFKCTEGTCCIRSCQESNSWKSTNAPDLPWSSVGFLALGFVVMCTSDWSNWTINSSPGQSNFNFLGKFWVSLELGQVSLYVFISEHLVICITDDIPANSPPVHPLLGPVDMMISWEGSSMGIDTESIPGVGRDVLERLEIKERKKEAKFPLAPWTWTLF